MPTPNDQARAFWHGKHRRPTVPDSQLRVSDAERNEIAEVLSRNYADGRLDEAEFNERLGRAMAAKTRADLDPLLADLPRQDGPDPAPPPRRSAGLGRVLVLALFVLFALSATTALVRPHVPWLLIGVVVLLVARRRRYRRYPFPLGRRFP